ncbi:hypothetical protein glysoja_049723 [Glycine soja]|uniref:Uncharacterized protein n=1 Tax=Glycine soja TaxID=3848 RepID=A0A0B2S9M9_GLYSO|nr:hypothetical protein glysoja_049723 [Glycine soja]
MFAFIAVTLSTRKNCIASFIFYLCEVVTRSSTSGKYKTSDVRFQLNSLRVLRI